MGVLKSLTDEYFKKTVRLEEGKKGNLAGYRVIMPTDCDESMFLKAFDYPYMYRRYDKGYGEIRDYMIIEGGEKSSVNLYMYDFENFRKTDNCLKFNINKTMFDSFVNILRSEMKDMEFTEEGYMIVGKRGLVEKLANDTGVNIGDLEQSILEDADKEFKFLLDDRTEHHIFYLGNDFYVLADRSIIRIKNTVYRSTIMNWLSNKLEELKKIDVKKYVDEKKKEKYRKWLESLEDSDEEEE